MDTLLVTIEYREDDPFAVRRPAAERLRRVDGRQAELLIECQVHHVYEVLALMV